jgi:hypothetical protein
MEKWNDGKMKEWKKQRNGVGENGRKSCYPDNPVIL